ncbi:hypothetical protein CEQ90_03140 [Lewinellaceae bacterium SD302]|nr:hypothetical protein CEQ90_03140 [Lewinellaceae bacterium SD302]
MLYPALTGLLGWLILILIFWPPSPLHLDYVRLILVAAPLAIVPLCLAAGARSINPWLTLALAFPFALGMLIPPGWFGTLLVLPWLAFSLWLTYQALKKSAFSLSLATIRSIAPPVFLCVAACWALADRAELNPMGFGPDITLLTAVHFHYAGFTLAWLVGRIRGPRWMQWGILGGVALVAVGITASQYDLPAWVEVASVSLLAVCALIFSTRIIRLGISEKRWLLVSGGLALGAGMLLALCYGWRYYFPIPALNIPVMYALHGSLNSLVFALPVVWSEAFFIRELPK